MKKYDNKETAPLLYHSIFLWIALPLSVITNTVAAISSFNSLYEDPTLFAVCLFDSICALSLAVMSAISFWGLRNWKPYSWYTIQISNIAVFIYNMIVIGIYSISGAFSFNDISQQLASITVAILVSIYYWKRKGIFFSQNVPVAEMAISAAEETSAASVPEHEETTADTQEAAAEPSQPTPPPAAQPTPEVQPEKKSTPSRSFIICILVVCVSLCANAYLAYQCSTLKTEVSDKEFLLTQAEYRERRYLEEIKRYQNNLGAISDEYHFYHDHAVIVTESGSRYHSYGCYHLNYDSFWIYNFEAAKSEGYTPCKDCNPPQ